jgi:hypothetical protein
MESSNIGLIARGMDSLPSAVLPYEHLSSFSSPRGRIGLFDERPRKGI